VPGSLPQCMVQNTGSQCTDVCASQTVGRQRSEQVTNHAERKTAFHVENIKGYAFENRGSVIYRPSGPTARRHQLAGDRPGLSEARNTATNATSEASTMRQMALPRGESGAKS
jgi:hypothetical protein